MPTIRISERTKKAIGELGSTFETPDDVIKRLIEESGHSNLLGEEKSDDKFENIPVDNEKFIELIKQIEFLDNEVEFKVDETMVSFYHPEIKRGNGLAWIGYPKANKVTVRLKKIQFPEEVDYENRIEEDGWSNAYKRIKIRLNNQDIEYLLNLIKYALKNK
ncbi:hypothetical protein AMET1_0012 [Methanonatronarchaeum thermophilum]|uniref:DUF5655 domain-containing protein n=1 Tax=Methanonatronarchaeum thermophilum TaxID=1927129 RepID=A0A1Y3GGA6_9EURY|nr:hypothetical protein [Methanonatronarchaeum thermophilum]OUJ19343.1 hypothetical protein AMET1_0012 [Methanonatronarchaeum thermophilum]